MDREGTTSSADTTKTTMRTTIMDTPTTMVHRWTDQEEALAHHTVDTTSHLNTRCSIENKVKDHQEEVVPHREVQQELPIQEISEVLLQNTRAVHQ